MHVKVLNYIVNTVIITMFRMPCLVEYFNSHIVAEGMACHEQCNETYRCWGPADSDCVVCNVYLYRNGSERICVDSCDSPRLNLLVVTIILIHKYYIVLLIYQVSYMLMNLQGHVEHVMRNVMILVLVQ